MITKQRVSLEGYNERDLSQYYVDTLLLTDNNEVVRVHGVRENKFVLHSDDIVDPTTLSRFLFTSGFYCVKGVWLFIHYKSGRGYKKSVRPDDINMSRVGEGRPLLANALQIMQAVVDDVPCPNSIKVSDRILIHEGKVWTGFNPTNPRDNPVISVGSYFDGELTTPYQCIKERLSCLQ